MAICPGRRVATASVATGRILKEKREGAVAASNWLQPPMRKLINNQSTTTRPTTTTKKPLHLCFWLFLFLFLLFLLDFCVFKPPFSPYFGYSRGAARDTTTDHSVTAWVLKLTGNQSLLSHKGGELFGLLFTDSALFQDLCLHFATSSTNHSVNNHWQCEKDTVATRVPFKSHGEVHPVVCGQKI